MVVKSLLLKVKVQFGADNDCVVDDVTNKMITCTTTSPSKTVELKNDGKHESKNLGSYTSCFLQKLFRFN